jgi:uncharacterized short protein YbdD (DUF466 family)
MEDCRRTDISLARCTKPVVQVRDTRVTLLATEAAWHDLLCFIDQILRCWKHSPKARGLIAGRRQHGPAIRAKRGWPSGLNAALSHLALTTRRDFTAHCLKAKINPGAAVRCGLERKVAGKPKYAVMLSSTYKELAEHRQAVQQALLSQQLFPVAMENDAALPEHDLVSASLAKVDEAEAYVGLISYRYGQIPENSERNPNKLSLTELEFRRALERKIPICMFIMHGDHFVPRRALNDEKDAERRKLRHSFLLLKRIVSTLNSNPSVTLKRKLCNLW